MGNIGNAILFTLAKCAPVLTTIIILAIVIAVIVGISKTMYKKAPPNTAMVITGPRGCRTAIGKGCFVIPIIQRVDYLSLENIQSDFTSRDEIPTSDAINILVDAVANVSISQDSEKLKIAASKFLGYRPDQIKEIITPVFEGNIREIISQTTLKELIQYYLSHQEEVIRRRTQFELNKAEARAHILEGLKKALDHIDEIIQLIRTSRTTEIIQQRLMDEFGMSDKQAKAVREMQLQRLAGLEREKIEEELNNLLITIADLKDILANEERILEIIRNELLEMKEKYGDKRRTEIIQGTFDIEDEDLIPVEDVIISLTNNGYVKRMPVDTYKSQNRGGRGVKGMATTQDDVISSLIHMSTHDDLLIFTNKGKVYRLKGYNIPEFGRTAKGLPIVNILNLDKDESVKSLININKKMIEEDKHWYLFFATEQGLVKRVDISEFENIRQTGKIAIKLKEDDSLVGVKLTKGDDEILIAASNGKLVRFSEGHVRPMGRSASGVKGINVDGSKVIGMTTNREGQLIMVVTEKGYGKMSPIDEYRVSNRGGKGVKTINVTERNGQIVAIRAVEGNEDLLIITDDGIVIRLPMEQVKTAGRATQGVRLIKVHDSKVSSVEVVAKNEEEVVEEGEEESE